MGKQVFFLAKKPAKKSITTVAKTPIKIISTIIIFNFFLFTGLKLHFVLKEQSLILFNNFEQFLQHFDVNSFANVNIFDHKMVKQFLS